MNSERVTRSGCTDINFIDLYETSKNLSQNSIAYLFDKQEENNRNCSPRHQNDESFQAGTIIIELLPY
jgi:hypothetical protein